MNERKDHPLFMISVIIPVFNGEKTIERAVHSILCNRDAETPIEIIIIDDGSTDATPTICDRLSEDTGIHVIHTENHGMVAARNIGIREAKGEYIGFVDSDDWIEPDMFQILLKTMIEQQADLVACGVIQETEQGSFRDEDDGAIIISQFPFIYHDILLSTGFRGYRWNKLYKKELISLETDKGITQCEDLLFNAAYCEHVSKAVYIRKTLYHYVRKGVDTEDYSYTKRGLSLMDAYEKLYILYLEKAPQYAYIPERNALKAYLHFRARAKLVHETDDSLLNKISSGIKAHFRRVMREKQISLKTKGNICATYLFPKTILRVKRKFLQRRHKLGNWES